VHPKRVARLMQTLGLETIAPKPRTPQPPPEYRGDPSVLRGLPMRRANHVWSTDIPSIRWPAGLIYLVAMMDWFRRYGLLWAVSMTLDGGVCLEALEVAPPDILTSDQGSQVTRLDFTRRLAAAGIRMSMDGRGRALDNIFVERLWRTVTYAEVYLKDDRPPREAIQGWEQCFALDHEQRPHQARGD
jgi:putative transposase